MAIRESVLSLVAAGDHRLMRRVNRWRPPRWLRLCALWATRAGDGWLWYALGLAILLAGDAQRGQALAGGALAAVSSVVCFQFMKRLANRRRPCCIEPHGWADLLPPDRFSFPSGHSMTAFAVATSVVLAYPALLGILLACALSVAASRILLGMHFLSDVLVGSVLGVLLGYAAYAVVH